MSDVTYEAAFEAIRDAIVEVKEGAIKKSDISEESRIMPDDDGEALDIDSLDALDMITLVEQRLNVRLPDDASIGDFNTIGDIARVLARATK